jgi:hypothetical protein
MSTNTHRTEELLEGLRTLRTVVADVRSVIPETANFSAGMSRRALDDVGAALELAEDAAVAALGWLRRAAAVAPDDATAITEAGRE